MVEQITFKEFRERCTEICGDVHVDNYHNEIKEKLQFEKLLYIQNPEGKRFGNAKGAQRGFVEFASYIFKAFGEANTIEAGIPITTGAEDKQNSKSQLIEGTTDKWVLADYRVFNLMDKCVKAVETLNPDELPKFFFEYEKINDGIVTQKGDGWMKKLSKNTILYGPPGTGKTYETVRYAVSIIENKYIEKIDSESYSDVYDRYLRYKEEKLIEFVTFHQSYGYEEFIEGIKPIMDENVAAGVLQYRIEKGTFVEFCERATAVKKVSDIELSDTSIWKVSLRSGDDAEFYAHCIENQCIRIGFDDIKPEEADMVTNAMNKDSILQFQEGMKKGDVVLAIGGDATQTEIGVIIGDFEFRDKLQTNKRYREVKWLGQIERNEIVSLRGGKSLPVHSVCALDSVNVKDLLALVNKMGMDDTVGIESNHKNHVFIIDEINRGNISKIFGELITLIEETKRLGAKEEIKVKLPYSKKLFGVPDNVYILGTMNTADRSIAALDTALRRRFQFVEMMPKADVLEGIEVEGISVRDLFVRMNKRIAILFDREHMIGHAYFVPLINDSSLECLSNIFKNTIIPLLQEYFYDDYEKIAIVLNDSTKEDTNRFIVLKEIEDDLISDENIDFVTTRYEINSDAFIRIDAYKGI